MVGVNPEALHLVDEQSPEVKLNSWFDALDRVNREEIPVGGQRFEEMARRIERITDAVNQYFEQLTPQGVLRNWVYWSHYLPLDRARFVHSNLVEMVLLDEKKEHTLVQWNRALVTLPLVKRWTYGTVETKGQRLLAEDALSCSEEFRLAQLLSTKGIANHQFSILPEIPLFYEFRRRWTESFEQLHNSLDQAVWLQFLYGVSNPFLERPPILDFIVDNLYEEWQLTLPESNRRPINEARDILDKVKRGLAEIGLAAVGGDRAWAYCGQRLPSEFMNYLLRLDTREKAMMLFGDLMSLAKRGQFLYPPQIYYLFNYLVPEEFRVSLSNGESLQSVLDKFYDEGHHLSDYVTSLQMIVSADRRGEEYQMHHEFLLEKIPPEHRGMVVLFSGPPIEALLKAWYWGATQLDTFDIEAQAGLLANSLVLKTEFEMEQVPYTRAEIVQRVVELSRQLQKGSVYPVDSNGQWLNHHRMCLPNDMGVNGCLRGKEVTIVLNQRGACLWLQGGQLLHQIHDDLQLLSRREGSLYVLTRGVVDRLLVDIGLKRGPDGQMLVTMLERTDCFYPNNSVLEFYKLGAFPEAKVRHAGSEELLLVDKQRSDVWKLIKNRMGMLIGPEFTMKDRLLVRKDVWQNIPPQKWGRVAEYFSEGWVTENEWAFLLALHQHAVGYWDMGSEFDELLRTGRIDSNTRLGSLHALDSIWVRCFGNIGNFKAYFSKYIGSGSRSNPFHTKIYAKSFLGEIVVCESQPGLVLRELAAIVNRSIDLHTPNKRSLMTLRTDFENDWLSCFDASIAEFLAWNVTGKRLEYIGAT